MVERQVFEGDPVEMFKEVGNAGRRTLNTLSRLGFEEGLFGILQSSSESSTEVTAVCEQEATGNCVKTAPGQWCGGQVLPVLTDSWMRSGGDCFGCQNCNGMPVQCRSSEGFGNSSSF